MSGEESSVVNGLLSIPFAEPLIAEVNHEPVAAIFVFYFAGRAYYVYGMSRAAHREKMPTYLLQWEAMKRAKAKGCSVYDLWGAPEVLRKAMRCGASIVSKGLGGKVVRTLGAPGLAPSPLGIRCIRIIPRVDVMFARKSKRNNRWRCLMTISRLNLPICRRRSKNCCVFLTI
jgi:lipid II:glycine glycyltransferase (peptidoglycan interpeptide bridge formation enzyme)